MKEFVLKNKNIIDKMKKITKRIKKDSISESAAECAYYTILSFIPFIIFFLSIIQYTIIDKQIIINLIEIITPNTMHNFIFDIIEEVYSKNLKTISISLIIALWSASKAFYSLYKSFKKIYKIKDIKTNFALRIESFVYTLFLMLSLMVVLILIVLGNRIHNFVVQKFFYYGIITSFILKTRFLITISLLFVLFLLIYRFIPKLKMNIKSQIPGAMFSSISWILNSFIFSIYIDLFKGFTSTYGSLSTIILIMIWLYTSMYIIMLGAEINVFISKLNNKKNNNIEQN